MIEQYLKPQSVLEAVAFKEQYGNDAIYFAGGSKLNATPTKTEKK
ncbi:hypothetical protein [Vibrio sp. SS-MA-C1-2]|nr:hypothetical protein [Vibrio sp. SS-MA-C1-2]